MTFKSAWLDWKTGSVSNVSDSPTYTREFCHTKIDTQNVISSDKTTEIRTHGTDKTAKTPELTLYQDPGERWFRDTAGRYWYLDRVTGQKTELAAGSSPQGEPLPQSFFEVFGSLLGIVLKRGMVS